MCRVFSLELVSWGCTSLQEEVNLRALSLTKQTTSNYLKG